MKLQVKSALIIIGTLVIGMILGGLISGMIRHQMHGKMADGPRGDRFERMMNRIIQPDESQAARLQIVMDRYAPKFSDQHRRHSDEMRKLVDSLNVELEPILTEEQINRLQKWKKRFSRRFRERGQRPGPPPPPPGGGL